MTSVSVTTNKNTVEVSEDNASVVVVKTVGPQGPVGATGAAATGFNLEQTARVDKSIVYYDAASSRFRADASITQSTLTDGGNF